MTSSTITSSLEKWCRQLDCIIRSNRVNISCFGACKQQYRPNNFHTAIILFHLLQIRQTLRLSYVPNRHIYIGMYRHFFNNCGIKKSTIIEYLQTYDVKE
jgi:hypothetical protein